MIALLMTGCADKGPTTSDASSNNTQNTAVPKDNLYFFNKNTSRLDYSGAFLFDDIIKKNIALNIKEIDTLKYGDLYELKLDPVEGISDERLTLGYFYVQKDKIYKIAPIEVNLKKLKSGELPEGSEIVCQDQEIKDSLDIDQPGWHQSLSVKEDIREYHAYNDQVETGYYESFIWEKNKGLISYESGFGAGEEIILKLAGSDEVSDMTLTTSADKAQQEIWQENSEKFINDIKDEAHSKGWGGIAASGAIVNSDSLVFYVMGSALVEEHPVTMLVYISFNNESPKGKLNQIRYFFQFNSDLSREILATDDPGLIGFFNDLYHLPIEVNTNSNVSITSASSAEGKTQQAIWQENSVAYINSAKDDLVSKEWENIVVSYANESADSLRYIITGQTDGIYDNAITMIANIVFDSESPEGKPETVVYISEAERHLVSDKLLAANDKELLNVMYSY